ncbi:hypothetical protein [Anaerosacchariphilus polymeriproducens]|uniref:Uncharacterized protein n=1 Tax=Anaerosacchariphilus polymeriproducens TaxID=1812858 RepID=A0A371AZC5_9FIRM|nr:hypothetical protein [Anaerosacchariphilus polymeriproducens]RDU24899.1 hypothetical protein DWV06_01320 [Anaerosacchariphilus polymeriproducens]
MKLFFYELRKSFLRKYVIVFLIVFSVLDVTKISLNYYQGNIDPILQENESNQGAAEQMYTLTKGSITQDKFTFLKKEEERLGEIYSKKLGNKDENEVTYSGNLYEDYRLLKLYIAEGFHYAENYSQYSKTITKIAEDNIGYYKKQNNFLSAMENKFIADTYSRRNITSFYRSDAVESYFDDFFSFILILIMCFLCIAPVFGQEYETNMNVLLLSSKKGRIKSTIIKMMASLCCGAFITLWFCLVDWLTYHLLCGFEGLDNPIWALPSFKESFLNSTITHFMLSEILLRVLAVIVIVLSLLILSLLLKKPLYVGGSFLVLLGGWYLLSRLSVQSDMLKSLVGLCNPVCLYLNKQLYQEFHYLEFGTRFYLMSNISIAGNIILAVVLILILFGLKRRMN